MANWSSANIQADYISRNDKNFDITTEKGGQFSNVMKSFVERTKEDLISKISGLGDVSIIGVNANYAQQMVDKLSDYQKNINLSLEEIRNELNPETYLRGEEIVPAVKEYNKVVFAALAELSNQLGILQSKLRYVIDAYRQKDTSAASSIRNTTSQVENIDLHPGIGAPAGTTN